MAYTDSRTIFNALAEEYDAYRPHYPAATISFLVTLGDLDRTSTVADIGTGTGHLAIALAPYIRLLYAVDTANQMLEQLRRNSTALGLSNIHTIEAPGEHTGLRESSLDLVALSQVFHWMDRPVAVQEMHRILKPGQPMIVMWNRIVNAEDEYFKRLQDLIIQFNPRYPGGIDIISKDFSEVIEHSNLFTAPELYTFPFSKEYNAEAYVGYLLSKSYIGVGIPNSIRSEFMEQAFDLLHSSFRGGRITEHYETVLLVARKQS
jgi:ubiquinone/menaquinone biosynthesis C-methylase UbiE